MTAFLFSVRANMSVTRLGVINVPTYTLMLTWIFQKCLKLRNTLVCCVETRVLHECQFWNKYVSLVCLFMLSIYLGFYRNVRSDYSIMFLELRSYLFIMGSSVICWIKSIDLSIHLLTVYPWSSRDTHGSFRVVPVCTTRHTYNHYASPGLALAPFQPTPTARASRGPRRYSNNKHK